MSHFSQVLKYASLADLPVTGNTALLYIISDTKQLYEWTGAAYSAISQGWSGTVNTFADLPAMPDPTYNGQVWLVTTATGVWPFNHPAGLYISNGTTWTQAPMTAGALTYPDIGVYVQAYSARLDEIAALTPTSNSIIIGNGSGWTNSTTPTFNGSNITNLTPANISAGTAGINISGNAATATALQTARNINGVSFNGTADITVTAAAGTLTGTTLAANVVTSSLTTLGSDASLPGSPTTTTQSAGDNSTKISTTAYVDLAINSVLAMEPNKASCNYATTAALFPTNTYSNGSGGVGATLTGTVAAGAIIIDGITPSVGDSILIKNEGIASHNGIYIVTVVGSVSVPYVLTRRSDFNSSSTITSGDVTFVTGGSTLGSTTWQMITAGTITVGTTSINWTQIAGVGTYLAGTNLTLTGNTFSLSSSYIGQNTITTIGTLSSGTIPFNLIGTGSNTTAAMSIGVGGSFNISTSTTSNWSAPGHIIVNGADSSGIRCLANNQTSFVTSICTSNTATDNAVLLAEQAGGSASAGDAITRYLCDTNSYNWATGIDNSDGGKYKISNSTNVGTNDNLSMTAAGAVSILRGDFNVTRSSSGSPVINQVTNTSNTSGSDARINISVAGSSAGDPFIIFDTSSVQDWAYGSDTSDARSMVLAASATLGTSNVWRMTTGGVRTMPLQPVFNAWKTGGAGNLTGDGTVTGVLIDAQNQQNGCYTGNQTYTANQTGYHLLIGSFQFTGLSASFTHGDVRVLTTSETYIPAALNIGAVRDVSNNATLCFAVVAKMTAGDTAISQFMASGGTKIVGVGGSATAITTFMGFQLC